MARADEGRRGYDVRAIANVILHEAWKQQIPVTNMHLNKVLYFLHVEYLVAARRPLVSAKIEAWEHGPVFREIYKQFKRFGREPITVEAMSVDYDTGELRAAEAKLREGDEELIVQLANYYIRFPAGALRNMSHEKGGAWHRVWHHESAFNVGMEITDDLIRELEVPRRNEAARQ